jgi:phosphoglycolate phosphatase
VIAAVAFDLDGVLVDSRVAFARCVNSAVEAHGLPRRPEEELHGFIGPPLHATFIQLGAGAAVQSCVDAYRARYVVHGGRETTVVPGIPEVLAALKPLPLFVVTSKPQALAEPLLDALGLRKWFAGVVGPALEVEHEPKWVTMGRALEQLGACRRAVMVGDRTFDVLGARVHGVPTIGVLWGIGQDRELRAAGAVALARDPVELLSLLRSAGVG